MQNNQPKIKYFDLYGLREEKYEFLKTHDVKNTDWRELELKEPHFWFVPKDLTGEEKYNKFLSLAEIFSFYNVGGKPGDDKILIDNNKSSLIGKIQGTTGVLKMAPEKADTEAKRKFLKILKKFCFEEENIIEYNYRPFDVRYTYYDDRIYTRPVLKLKKQFDSQNIALLTTKILKAEPFKHIFISNIFSDVIFLSNKTSTNTFVFPLFYYGVHKDNSLIKKSEIQETNFSPEFWNRVKDTFIEMVDPWQIFYYIYAILYSNTYRKKYNEFLKIDFPKIPFAKDKEIFFKMSELGKELANLHLLKSEKLENPAASFPIAGDSRVRKRESNLKEKRIYINDKQYFEGVEQEVWNYCIGGYQVLDKWLKDRIGRILSPEDVSHYLKVITALKYTIIPQKEIDKIYPEVEKKLLTF